jgi:AraC-like DNA-binding protein
VIITSPGIPHGTSNYPEERGCLYWAIIKSDDPSVSLLGLSKKGSRLIIEKLLKNSNLKFAGNKTMKKSLDLVFLKAEQKRDDFSKIEISHYLMNFLLDVIYASEKHVNRHLHPCTSQVIEYIQNNCCENIQLEFLANMCNWSLSHFKQKFKLDTGIPPGDFIQREKIKKATLLLRNTNESISTIAWQLGFTSPGYFSTVFKKYTGTNPQNYRLSRQDNSSDLELLQEIDFGYNMVF